MNQTSGESTHVLAEVQGRIGCITLNRPQALNALSLPMVRDITASLRAWRDDAQVLAVAIRGVGKDRESPDGRRPFGAFCAGGDIRFFHQAALAGDPALEDFFTEEYTLNHLIHRYPKPTLAFMDGVVMGGGMGIAQGARWRIVTERTKMAMPETAIGLFPDVGGGYSLSRCPGRVGEYLALTGEVIGADAALQFGLADVQLDSSRLPTLWRDMTAQTFADGDEVNHWIATTLIARKIDAVSSTSHIELYFGVSDVTAIVHALRDAAEDPWAQNTLDTLRKRSPLMLHVVLEQIRRARSMSLADDLRMERAMVRHCFHLRPGVASETVEGIRALAVDKDYAPKWQPACVEDVTPQMVQPFFASPWPAHAHPLRDLN